MKPVILEKSIFDERVKNIKHYFDNIGASSSCYRYTGANARTIYEYSSNGLNTRLVILEKEENPFVIFEKSGDINYLSDYILFKFIDNAYPELVGDNNSSLDKYLTSLQIFLCEELENVCLDITSLDIPSGGSFAAILETHLTPFLQNMGFGTEKKEKNAEIINFTYQYKEFKLILSSVGRLDNGEVNFVHTHKYGTDKHEYSNLLKKIKLPNQLFKDSIGSWKGGGFSSGNYYVVSKVIRNTILDIIQNLKNSKLP